MKLHHQDLARTGACSQKKKGCLRAEHRQKSQSSLSHNSQDHVIPNSFFSEYIGQ